MLKMRLIKATASICRRIARLLSFAISLYGLVSFAWIDCRQDTFAMILFWILPVLSFPVTLLSFRSLRWSIALHWILALGYLAVYSFLDWRTCAELGYCQGLLPVVLITLFAWPLQVMTAIAVLNSIFALLVRNPDLAPDEPRAMGATR